MRTHSTSLPPVLAAALLAAIAATAGCDGGGDGDNTGGSNTGTNSGASSGSGGSSGSFTTTGTGGSTPQCVNLECQQVACTTPGTTTTVSGTVYDPSGTLPLYGVSVYVPNSSVDPINPALVCGCDAISGSPLVSAITDTQGKFTLQNVPVGSNIPVVIQVGKWRRQITIPTVAECVDTPLADPNQTRLPRDASEGDLPHIALTTGGSDALFCLLRRLGISDSEYGIQGQADKHVHLYTGANGATRYDNGFGTTNGADFPDGTTTLWNNGWNNYDIVMMSCEGDTIPAPKNGHRVALRDYLNVGGKVFATHYHYNWFQGDAPADLQSVAQFTDTFTTFDDIVDIDQTFPKGMALAQWLFNVDGSSPLGSFFVNEGRQHTVSIDPTLARQWVTWNNKVEYFSFNAPIGAMPDAQCGRMVFSDIHVSAGAGDASGDFPSACSNNPLSEQEKALIFMFFDLSACVIPDDQPPCAVGQSPCTGPGDPTCNGSCVNNCCNEIPG
jgi:hypothetical protein